MEKDLKNIVPEPISYYEVTMPLSITEDKVITFTDCVEITLFSLLRMFFVDLNNPKQLDLAYAKDCSPDPDVLAFLTKHSNILSNEEFRETDEGIQIRTDWTAYLSCREGFVYNKESKFDTQANQRNIIYFFKTFFKKIPIPTLESPGDFEIALDAIFEYFSRPEYKLESNVSMGKYGDEENCLTETLIEIFVNGIFLFTWKIWESFTGGIRQGGHTQIYDRKL